MAKGARLQMRLTLDRLQAVPEDRAITRMETSDASAIAELLLAAYRGTVDDEGETIEDARAEVERTLEGSYGPFLAECSFLGREGERLVGASLLTLWEEMPLLAHILVDPGMRRRGLGTALLRASAAALLAGGFERVDLFVTEANAPAVALYRSLGFEVVARHGGDPAGTTRSPERPSS